MIEPRTHTLPVDGATLTYDVRDPGTGGPPLLLFGSPMDAGGFAELASRIEDRVVVTYDPRGTGRSPRTDDRPLTPRLHADDLRALAAALGPAPVDAFATSGGAVNALVWAGEADAQVRTLVAHEPPLRRVLSDDAAIAAALDDVAESYQRDGFGAGMARFIALVSHQGQVPSGFRFPPLDPSAFGLPSEDDGRRDDPLLGLNLLSCTGVEPDLDGLRSVSARIVLARGEESGQTIAARAADATAAATGRELVLLPGDHVGFLGGGRARPGRAAEFAARLCAVLERT